MKSSFKYTDYEIIEKKEVSPDTFWFKLKGTLNFEPGNFVQAMVPHVGEATFAPCSSHREKTNFELVIRAVGSTTKKIVELLPGDKLSIRGPYGNSWPLGTLLENNIIIVAGGMGIVPLRPLIYELIKYKKNFNKVAIVAGFKTPHHVLFEKDFVSWQKQVNYLKVGVEKGERSWWGDVCMITDLLKKIKFSPKNTKVLMCGPEIMFSHCNDILHGNKKISHKDIFISFERKMECGVGLCQHCNIGKYLVCKDGPIFRYDKIKDELKK